MDIFLNNFLNKYVNPESITGGLVIGVLLTWSLIWKGVALWKSARNNERAWFVAILIINTVGILEIAYLFFFAKQKFTFDEIKTNIKSYKIKNPLALKK